MCCNITIKEYREKYAKSIADMWNESSGDWENSVKTEESVKQEENRGAYKKLFLALDGEKVVGYCKFDNFQKEKNVDYIALLNVSPGYRGKKIGKALILRALEESLKTESTKRLDLYTWEGNLKAMPLYKKCGFCWDGHTTRVHLMNFLPLIFKMEYLKSYLEKIDWYKDRKDKITMEPDNKKEGEFQFFRYNWENESCKLLVEIERKGRVIKKINTDELFIELKNDSKYGIKGRKNSLKLIFRNKNEKEKNIIVRFKNSEFFASDFTDSFALKREVEVSIPFDVKKVRDLKANESFSVAEVEIEIDGKQIVMGLGLEPVFPIKITLKAANYPSKKPCFYMECENLTKENIQYNYLFMKTQDLKGIVSLSPQERKSLTLFPPDDTNYIDEFIRFFNDCGEDFEIKNEILIPKKENYGTEKNRLKIWYKNSAIKEFFNYCNTFQFTYFYNEKNVKFLFNLMDIYLYNEVGDEFYNKEHEKVVFSEENGQLTAIIPFVSKRIKGFEFFMKVFVENKTTLKISFHFNENNIPEKITFRGIVNISAFPWNNVIVLSPMVIMEPAVRYSDSWLYNDDSKAVLEFKGWNVVAQGDYGQDFLFELKERKETTPLVFHLKKYFEPQEFTKIEKKKTLPVETAPYLEINSRNLFYMGEVPVYFNNIYSYPEGEIEFYEGNSLIKTIKLTEKSKQLDKKAELNLSGNPANIKAVLKINGEEEERFFTFFEKKDRKVDIEKKETGEYKVWQIKNKNMLVKCAENYAPFVYSLIFNGEEFFNPKFPEKYVWDFLNPHTGGLAVTSSLFSARDLYSANCSFEEYETFDNRENCWQGIKTTLKFPKESIAEGIILETYQLTVKNVPIFCIFFVVKNESGKVHANFSLTVTFTPSLESTIEVKGKYPLKSDSIYHRFPPFLKVRKNDKTVIVFTQADSLRKQTTRNGSEIFSTVTDILKDRGSFKMPPLFFIGDSDNNIEEERIKYLREIEFMKGEE